MGNTFEKGYIFYKKDLDKDYRFENLLNEYHVSHFLPQLCDKFEQCDGQYFTVSIVEFIKKTLSEISYPKYKFDEIPKLTPFKLDGSTKHYITKDKFSKKLEEYFIENGYILEHYLVRKCMENCIISLESNQDKQITIKDAVEFINYNKELQIAKESFEKHKMEMENGKS